MTNENKSKSPAPVPLEVLPDLRASLEKQGSINIVLVSGSMAPLLPTGSTAVIKPAKFSELAMRDIIVFWSAEKLVCHCVWAHSTFPSADGQRMIITRGLASLGFDYPVRESEFLGKVTSHKLSAGRFVMYWLLWKIRSFVAKSRSRSHDSIDGQT